MNSASLCSLAGWYDNPIPTRLLALINCLKFQLRLFFIFRGTRIGLYQIHEGSISTSRISPSFLALRYL
jgi:hypothetical protein